MKRLRAPNTVAMIGGEWDFSRGSGCLLVFYAVFLRKLVV